MRRPIRGFYAIVDEASPELVLALLRSAKVLQVRKKPATPAELLTIATMARDLTAKLNAMLVINDDIDLAHRVGADGVHLGQDDTPLREARRRTDLCIGISTHDLKQLERALGDGADYVAFGPVFPTKTKDDPDPVVGLDGLARAAELCGDVPLVAIGGISAETVHAVRAAGANAACVISAVNRASDVAAAAAAMAAPWPRA